MWLGVLGPLDVRHEDAVIAVPAAKQRIVLGTLLIHANQVVSFEQLVEAVWDGSPPDGARVTLRNYIKTTAPDTGAHSGPENSHSRYVAVH
jgi:DNA-binding SARP family transcriptional activator